MPDAERGKVLLSTFQSTRCGVAESTLQQHVRLSRKIGDAPGCAGQFQDMQPSIGTTDNVHMPAPASLDFIGLTPPLTASPAAGKRDTALVSLLRDRRDVKGDFLGVVRVTDIHRPDTGVE